MPDGGTPDAGLDAGVDAGFDAGLRDAGIDAGVSQPGTCFGEWCWVQPTPTGRVRNAQFLGPSAAFVFGNAGTFLTIDGGPMQRVPVPELISSGVQGPSGEFWFPGAMVIHRRLPNGTFTTLAYPDSTSRVLARSADGGLWVSGMTSAFLFQEPGWLPALLPMCPFGAQFEPIGRTALMSCTDFPSTTTQVFEVAPATMPRALFVGDGGLPLLRARTAEGVFLLYGGPQQTVLQLQFDGGVTPFSRPEALNVSFSSNSEHLLMQGATTAWHFSSGSWTVASPIPAGREFDLFDLAMPSGVLSGPSELFFFGTASTWPTITTQVPPANRTSVLSVTPFDGPGPLPRFLIGDGVYDLAADGGLSPLTSLGLGQRRIAGTRDGGFIAVSASGLLSRWNNGTSALATASISVFGLNALAVANDDSALLASLNQLYRLPPGSMSPQAFDAGDGVRGFISATTTPLGSVLVATQTQVFDVGPLGVAPIPAPAGGYLGNIESACATSGAIYVKTFTDLWIRQGGQWRRTAPGVVAKLACTPSRAAIVGTSWLEFQGDGGTRTLESLPLVSSEMAPLYGADGRLWIGASAGELLFHP